MVFPQGFALPPLGYLLGLSLALAIVVFVLVRLDPPVTEVTVLALAPWMAVGGALHAAGVQAIAPQVVDPLLGTPAVYATTAIIGGCAWILGLHRFDDAGTQQAWILGGVGVLAFGLVATWIFAIALSRGAFAPTWPTVGLALSVVMTAVIWTALRRGRPELPETTGWVGLLLVFGHVVDAVSTAVGIDILGVGERSPLPVLIMDLAARVPIADVLGVGWAFVLVKVALVVAILWLFTDFVRESPREAYLVLAGLTAVGLGPGVHNLLLFAVAG